MIRQRVCFKNLVVPIWFKGEGMKTNISFIVVPILLMAIYMTTTSVPVKACFYSLKIEILSPKNMIYATNSIPLTFTINKPTSWIGYSLDEQANITIQGNITLTDLQDGWHDIIVYANDTCGRKGASCKVYFAVDTTPPNITNVHQLPFNDSVSPEDEVKVNATVTDDVSGVKRVILFYAYADNSGTWIRVENMTKLEGDIWNATIPAFPYGTNVTYTISAEDNVGNIITTVEMGYDIQYQVIPEFSPLILLPLFMIATLIATAIYRRKTTS
jgi:hypothetical protein